mmetsp:Transcript_4485/g.6940  ORF Transcript_4485/g.6940 Transcript_4485/m.6940 type:complete len:237 (-) Transcript_4485:59-769(-)
MAIPQAFPLPFVLSSFPCVLSSSIPKAENGCPRLKRRFEDDFLELPPSKRHFSESAADHFLPSFGAAANGENATSPLPPTQDMVSAYNQMPDVPSIAQTSSASASCEVLPSMAINETFSPSLFNQLDESKGKELTLWQPPLQLISPSPEAVSELPPISSVLVPKPNEKKTDIEDDDDTVELNETEGNDGSKPLKPWQSSVQLVHLPFEKRTAANAPNLSTNQDPPSSMEVDRMDLT